MPPPDGQNSVPIPVGIGLIERNGHYLIRQRPALPGSPMPGLWEFPGGKCDPGEAPEVATRRECLEETGLAIRVRNLRRVIVYAYPHGVVQLHYFDCVPDPWNAEPLSESGFQWVDAIALPSYRFPPANAEVLDELAQQARSSAAG